MRDEPRHDGCGQGQARAWRGAAACRCGYGPCTTGDATWDGALELTPALLAAAEAALDGMRARGVTVATAESCTGGLITAALTAVAGSSDVVDCGFVTYSNAAKVGMLGVDPAVIAAHGAVSALVAAAMAEGALARSGAGIAVAVTGVAGPGGGSPDKPVGTVWFGLATRGSAARTERIVFPGDRAAVREATALHALGLLAGAGPRRST